jgi:hypothetical protein
MIKALWLNISLILISFVTFAQVEKEIDPPFNIKTITFVQNNQNSIALFGLNDSFEIQFDDLYGNEANYYYEIVHCNYDWKHSDLSKNEYLQGFDGIRIQEYTNSLNTLQLYSHYRIGFPNKNTQLYYTQSYLDLQDNMNYYDLNPVYEQQRLNFIQYVNNSFIFITRYLICKYKY